MENIKENKKSFLISILKGTLISLSSSLILILIFAFMLRFINISDNLIKAINQIIKCISILLGVFYALKNKKNMGLVTGLIVGLLFVIVSFVVFSILDGNFMFSKTLINDILFGSILGSICGIISVSIKK